MIYPKCIETGFPIELIWYNCLKGISSIAKCMCMLQLPICSNPVPPEGLKHLFPDTILHRRLLLVNRYSGKSALRPSITVHIVPRFAPSRGGCNPRTLPHLSRCSCLRNYTTCHHISISRNSRTVSVLTGKMLSKQTIC